MHEFVARCATGYALGSRLHQAEDAARATVRTQLRRIAMPYMLDVRRATGATVLLAVLSGVQVVYLDTIYGRTPVCTPSTQSHRAPTHATAAGKLLLAFQPDTFARHIPPTPLPAYTSRTRTTMWELTRELAGIRRRCIAFNQQEYAAGVVCAAAPIIGPSGQPVAAFTISGAAGELDPYLVAPRLHGAAVAVSRVVRGLPPVADPTR